MPRPATHYAFDVDAFTPPEGWVLAVRDSERTAYRDDSQTLQATVSKLDLDATPSFEEFERLCRDRMEAERQVLTDGFVKPTGSAPTPKGFIAMYMGADRSGGRMFSGCMLLVEATLFTIYVEAAGGTDPQAVGTAFKSFVSSCRNAIRRANHA